MNKKDIMKKFINMVINRKLFTRFINTVFEYDILRDYNYMFRIKDINNKIIIDIYDNVSVNRFNRYVFDFVSDYIDVCDYYVTIKYIDVMNSEDGSDNLSKFSYLFKIDDHMMIDYANSFLDIEFVNILKNIIK